MEKHFLNGNEIHSKIMSETRSEAMQSILTDVIDAKTEEPLGYGLGYSIYYYYHKEEKELLDVMRITITTDFSLPMLSLQPLVENAVKHGVCKKVNGGTVKISVHGFSDRIEISVEDDGVGFDTNIIPGWKNTHRYLQCKRTSAQSLRRKA